MSTTRELEQAFEAKRSPDQVKTIAIRRFELSDPSDMESPLVELLPQEVAANYCWRLDVVGVSYWISQGDNKKLLAALKPLTDEEDQGEVVGTLTKIELDGKTLRYGPVELQALPWRRLQSSGVIV